MPLTKNDLKQIRTVVKEEISESEKRTNSKFKKVEKKIEDEIGFSEKRLGKKVEDEVGGLALMTKHGFDAVDKRFDQVEEQMLVHDFKMTEMVHKSDHFHLEERVDGLEKKAGLRR